MRIALTGTPGTGKSTTAELLADAGFDVIHLNEAIRERELWTERDAERDSLVADLGAIGEWLGDREGVVESHLAHYVEADAVVVLRCHPAELERRLRERGDPDPKVRENAESEALDVILSEAVERHGLERVYEVDTTDRTSDAVADAVRAVAAGEREPSAGDVDFTDYL